MDTINVGQVSQRIEISGTVRSMRWIELDYPVGGRTDVHIVNDDGVHAYWQCSKRLEDEGVTVGQKIAVRATIKGYEHRDDELVVRITNGRVLSLALF